VRAADYAYLSDPAPLALAHRGGAAYGPNVGLENTMAAFGRAVGLGYRFNLFAANADAAPIK